MNHTPAVLMVGGRPVHQRLAGDLPRITELVLAEVTARLPAYRRLPDDALSGEIAGIIERALSLFATVLQTAQLPTPRDMAFMRESAARRAEEGLPFDAVLTAYHIGVQVLWDSLAPDVRPDEVRDLMAVNSLALRCLELVTPAVGAGYLDERRTALDDESSARQALLSALLSGVAAELATAREGLHVPPGYLVLAVAVHQRPDDLGAGGDATVAGRRRLGRLRAELHRQAGGPVLSSLTPDGGIVLLERPRGVGEPTKRDRDRLDRLVADVGRVAGADLTVGVTAAEPAGVAAAAEIAREVLAVVRRSGRAPGVYQLDDVLLDYQLSRPGAALERLAAILLPLAGSDELVETLATFLRAGGRRPAASELHVHPNTVDYRLRKVLELTGLDATRIADASLLGAALAARTSCRP
ncbi:MAG TPA: helix-turn-helix domain-containing protein [Pseudonocardia sp.]|nr:helix-turn-helix domain-containing protein [Pseudonocardia sp.]